MRLPLSRRKLAACARYCSGVIRNIQSGECRTMMLCQRNDARSTMSIAARTFHVTQGNPDRCLWVTRLHASITVPQLSQLIISQ